ncbi:hypothetical protein M1512_00360 [Patescibacteria group bacterium]|nr:hypothetical protein [Patescibacteria group bacterium]
MRVNYLDSFIRDIFSISPRYIDIFGNYLPGMAGTSIATQGAITSQTDVIRALRHDVSSLLKLKVSANSQTVIACSKNIEGRLLLLQTLGVISDKRCTKLIDELNRVTYL